MERSGDESTMRSLGGGLSLVEFTVVAAIIAVLVALTAVVIMGPDRTDARASDIARVREAVARFRSETTVYPTRTMTTANRSGTEGTDYFRVIEGPGGVNFDVDGDGNTDDTINVVPIDWNATDPNESSRVFSDFLTMPEHAHPTDPITINADSSLNVLTDAWVIDANGEVLVLIPRSSY